MNIDEGGYSLYINGDEYSFRDDIQATVQMPKGETAMFDPHAAITMTVKVNKTQEEIMEIFGINEDTVFTYLYNASSPVMLGPKAVLLKQLRAFITKAVPGWNGGLDINNFKPMGQGCKMQFAVEMTQKQAEMFERKCS